MCILFWDTFGLGNNKRYTESRFGLDQCLNPDRRECLDRGRPVFDVVAQLRAEESSQNGTTLVLDS
jgi:hypothetical protein